MYRYPNNGDHILKIDIETNGVALVGDLVVIKPRQHRRNGKVPVP